MRIMALTRFAAGGDVIVTAGRKYGGSILQCGVKAISGDRLGYSSWHEGAPSCSEPLLHTGRIALAC